MIVTRMDTSCIDYKVYMYTNTYYSIFFWCFFHGTPLHPPNKKKSLAGKEIHKTTQQTDTHGIVQP